MRCYEENDLAMNAAGWSFTVHKRELVTCGRSGGGSVYMSCVFVSVWCLSVVSRVCEVPRMTRYS